MRINGPKDRAIWRWNASSTWSSRQCPCPSRASPWWLASRSYRRNLLDATYFDTPKQDLARNNITLRRRTSGPDAGWHLKLPARSDARIEIRARLWSHTAIRCQPSYWMWC